MELDGRCVSCGTSSCLPQRSRLDVSESVCVRAHVQVSGTNKYCLLNPVNLEPMP